MKSKIHLGFVLVLLLSWWALPVKAEGGKTPKAISRSYGRIGTLVDVSIYYGQTEATANPAAGNSWQNTTAIYDLKGGYITDSSIYIGAVYTSRSDNQVSAASASGSSVGIGGGYFADSGFNIRGYYKFNDTYGDYKNGSGFEANLGYLLNPTSNFFFGLNVSVRQSTYTSNSVIPGFNSWTRKETYPFLTFGFLIN